MRRTVVTLLVLALLGGAAVAFAVTEALKLEPWPITAASITKRFAPEARCGPRHAKLSFRLRRRDRIEAVIIDADGRPVRVLASGKERRPGRVRFTWRGVRDGGAPARDGEYRLRIHLADLGRTIVIPKAVRLDRAGLASAACEGDDARTRATAER